MGGFTFRLIFFVLLWPVLPLISLLMANEAKVKKNIILGVTLPYTGQHDARVQEIARRFKRAQWLWCGAGSAIFAAVMFLGGNEGVLILALVLLPAAVLLPYVFFARANKKLRAMKSAEGWRTPYAGSVVVDMKAAAGDPGGRLKRALFIPPVAVSLVPAVYGLIASGAERTDALLFSLPMALVCLLCWALYPLIFRQRADVVDTDSDLNAALTRVRRYNWGKMLLGTEYLTAAFGVAFWLLRNDGLWTTLLTIAYMFALIAFCLSTEFAVRRAQERLTAAHRSDEYVDEDDLWLWGLFYNNPNDRHIFINDRTGSGMGVNVGRQFVFLSFCAVALSSSSVAFGGNFFFLGLIGPHIARRLVGTDARVLLPASGIVAGIIVMLADMLVQGISLFANIPTGIIVSVLSVPYFLYLLIKS